jgi:hypothetical protein
MTFTLSPMSIIRSFCPSRTSVCTDIRVALKVWFGTALSEKSRMKTGYEREKWEFEWTWRRQHPTVPQKACSFVATSVNCQVMPGVMKC